MKHKWLCPISSPTFPGIPSNSPRCPWGFSMALVSTHCNAINSNAFSPWASCHRVTNLYWLSGFAIDLSGWAVFKRSRLGEIYWVITPETLVTIIITIAVTQAHEQDPSQVKSSHLYLYSAFNNTNCNKALHNIKIGKFVNNVKWQDLTLNYLLNAFHYWI